MEEEGEEEEVEEDDDEAAMLVEAERADAALHGAVQPPKSSAGTIRSEGRGSFPHTGHVGRCSRRRLRSRPSSAAAAARMRSSKPCKAT